VTVELVVSPVLVVVALGVEVVPVMMGCC